ncbi:MAG: amidase, partial [Actinomycetia bacterium]|nr:amidase [Actinomycetes bacterium]
MGPASEIASQVRTGRLSAAVVIEEALDRAESAQAELNAYTLIDKQRAIDRARHIDATVAGGADPGPLAGVPIGLKDLIDQAGLPNTRGSSFAAQQPSRSAEVVHRLEHAGGVIIGRTGLHEFAFGFSSENPWFGAVRNPWDLETSPGGSSGGSAATVAAGTVPIAIGTDTGGSVRVPAALCGILGLKVTHGRVPLSGVFPLAASLDTVGPFARSVDDLATTYLAIAGDHPADPWSWPVPVEAPGKLDDPSQVRIGVVRQWFASLHTREIAADIESFIERCSHLGMDMVEIDEDSLRPIDAATKASRAEILDVHDDMFQNDPERYGDDLQRRLKASYDVTLQDLVVARRWQAAARATVQRLTNDGITAFLAPTVGVMRKEIGRDMVDIDGTEIFYRDPLANFTSPINA